MEENSENNIDWVEQTLNSMDWDSIRNKRKREEDEISNKKPKLEEVSFFDKSPRIVEFNIFKFLSTKKLLTARRVSKRWNKSIEEVIIQNKLNELLAILELDQKKELELGILRHTENFKLDYDFESFEKIFDQSIIDIKNYDAGIKSTKKTNKTECKKLTLKQNREKQELYDLLRALMNEYSCELIDRLENVFDRVAFLYADKIMHRFFVNTEKKIDKPFVSFSDASIADFLLRVGSPAAMKALIHCIVSYSNLPISNEDNAQGLKNHTYFKKSLELIINNGFLPQKNLLKSVIFWEMSSWRSETSPRPYLDFIFLNLLKNENVNFDFKIGELTALSGYETYLKEHIKLNRKTPLKKQSANIFITDIFKFVAARIKELLIDSSINENDQNYNAMYYPQLVHYAEAAEILYKNNKKAMEKAINACLSGEEVIELKKYYNPFASEDNNNNVNSTTLSFTLDEVTPTLDEAAPTLSLGEVMGIAPLIVKHDHIEPEGESTLKMR